MGFRLEEFKGWLAERIKHEKEMKMTYKRIGNISGYDKQAVYIQALEEVEVKFGQLTN